MDVHRFYARVQSESSSLSFARQFEKKLSRQSLSKTSMNHAPIHVNEKIIYSNNQCMQSHARSMNKYQVKTSTMHVNDQVGDCIKPKVHWTKQQLLDIKEMLDQRGAKFDMKFRERHANGITNFVPNMEFAENWGNISGDDCDMELKYENIPPCMKRYGLGNLIAYGCKFMTPDRFVNIPSEIVCQFPSCNTLHEMPKPITVIRNHCLPKFVKSTTCSHEHFPSGSREYAPTTLNENVPTSSREYIPIRSRVFFRSKVRSQLQDSSPQVPIKVEKSDIELKKGWNLCQNMANPIRPANYFENFPDLSEYKFDGKYERKHKAKSTTSMKGNKF